MRFLPTFIFLAGSALLLDGCASGTYVESSVALDDGRSYQNRKFEQSVRGETDLSRDEIEKNAKDVARLASKKPNEPYWTQELEFSTSNGGYKLKVRSESGWLPEKYIEMLNDAVTEKYLLSYKLCTAGITDGDAKLELPVAIARKADGTYCFLAYERNDDDKLSFALPVMNVAKYNDHDGLIQAITNQQGAVRTDLPALPEHLKTAKVRKNCPVNIRTSNGTKSIIVPYVTIADDKATVVLDSELEAYLEACDALPKCYEVLR